MSVAGFLLPRNCVISPNDPFSSGRLRPSLAVSVNRDGSYDC
jgi:hypothetical protein